MLGKITSLNASVAGGIFMYEIVRQRQIQDNKGVTELSDNKFSVDDILNEYSKKKEQKSKSKSTFNVDEFFASSQVSVNENKKKSFDFNINDNNSGFAPENNANKATTPLPENNINEKTNLKSENNISDNINSKENALKPLRRIV